MGLKVFTTPSVPLTGDRNPSRKGKNVTALQGFFSKIIPSFFVDKASCTRQFESELSLHSLASLFPIKEGFFRKPTRPSLPLRKAPPLTPTLSPSGKREGTAPPRRSEPLRSKVGGPKRSSPYFAGWDRRERKVYS